MHNIGTRVRVKGSQSCMYVHTKLSIIGIPLLRRVGGPDIKRMFLIITKHRSQSSQNDKHTGLYDTHDMNDIRLW